MTTSNVTATEGPSPEAVVATSKHWGVLLSFGLIAAGFGLAFIIWPDKTVAVAAVFMGLSLLISGVFGLVASFTQPDQSTGSRVLMAISGAVSVALGLVAFQGISQAIAILVLVVGIGWIMRGIMELIAGLQAAKGVPGRGATITAGIIAIGAGAAILLWPNITLTVLVWIVGLTLILIGAIQILAAFALRAAGKRAAAELPPVVAGEVVTS
jgi:uncharacterized membrane protein HdeD (DUF308 family)